MLDVRAEHLHGGATLSDLYDPWQCRAISQGARKLDRTVDRCYRSSRSPPYRQRVEFLFALTTN